MPYEWSKEAPAVSTDPAFEPHYRQAISTACGFLEQVVTEESELPHFSSGQYASAQNDAAMRMLEVISASLTLVSSDRTVTLGHPMATLITMAVRAAYSLRSFGFTADGWQTLMDVFSRGNQTRRI